MLFLDKDETILVKRNLKSIFIDETIARLTV